jgi:hypothetical protein
MARDQPSSLTVAAGTRSNCGWKRTWEKLCRPGIIGSQSVVAAPPQVASAALQETIEGHVR